MKRFKEFLEEDVAETIIKQIGLKAFKMMGAKPVTKAKDNKGNEYISFKIGRNPKGVNYIKVTYDAGKDLYDIEFIKIHGMKVTVKSKETGIYVNMLKSTIESNTGMALSL